MIFSFNYPKTKIFIISLIWVSLITLIIQNLIYPKIINNLNLTIPDYGEYFIDNKKIEMSPIFLPDSMTFNVKANFLYYDLKQFGFSRFRDHFHDEPLSAGIGLIYFLLNSNSLQIIFVLNAILHSLSAVIIYFIFSSFNKNRFVNFISPFPFIFLPSSSVWYSQIHKDGIFIFSILILIFCWLKIINLLKSNSKIYLIIREIFTIFILLSFSYFFIGIIRPYFLEVIIPIFIFMFFSLIIFVALKFKFEYLYKPFSILSIFLIINTILIYAFIEREHRFSNKFSEILKAFSNQKNIIEELIPNNNYNNNNNNNKIASKLNEEITQKSNEEIVLEINKEKEKNALKLVFPNLVSNNIENMMNVPFEKDFSRWQISSFWPIVFDDVFFRLLLSRKNFIETEKYSNNMPIDTNLNFKNVNEILIYLPLSLLKGLYAPSFESVKNIINSNSYFKYVIIPEILLIFPLVTIYILGFFYFRKLEIYILSIFCISSLTAYSFAIVNLGSFIRLRYPFICLLCSISIIFIYEIISLYYKSKKND